MIFLEFKMAILLKDNYKSWDPLNGLFPSILNRNLFKISSLSLYVVLLFHPMVTFDVDFRI